MAGHATFELVGIVILVLVETGGCQTQEPSQPVIDEVPDCAVLVRAARRAAGCDPNLLVLADELSRNPVEARCRAVARRLLTGKRSEPPRVHSLHEPLAGGSASPLDPSERATLLKLPLPAMLTVIPDLAPGPGVPQTRGLLNSIPLESDPRGRLHGRLEPGLHTMTVRHAGQETHHCIDLEPCARLTVAAHGSSLAQHPRIRRGPCNSAAPAEPDPASPVANR